MKTILKPTFLSRKINIGPARRWLAAFVALGLLAGNFAAWGATVTWTGGAGGGDLNWGTAENWDIGAPVDGDDIIFPSVAGGLVNPVNELIGLTVNSVTFTGGGYTVSGNEVIISSGFTNSSGALNGFNCPIILGGDQTFNINGNTTFGGTIVNDYSLIVYVSPGTKTAEFQNVVSGAGGITKLGPGVLKMFGVVNTYTGKTLVTGGTLFIDREASLGSDPGTFAADQLTLDGATLQVNNTANLGEFNPSLGITLGSGGGTFLTDNLVTCDIKQAVTGPGALIKAGSTGILKLSVANTYEGKTIVNGGILRINGENRLGPAPAAFTADQLTIANGATLNIPDVSFVISDSTRGVTIGNGGGIVSPDSGIALEIARPITGVGALTKAGAGSLTISVANDYSGGTTNSLGTLNINHSSALGSGTFTISGGTIDNTGSGAITLSTYNNVQNWNGNFVFTGTQDLNLGTGNVTLSAARTVTANAKTLTVGGVVSGAFGLTKLGGGTLFLSGTASTYTGQTKISAGILKVNSINGVNAVSGSSIGQPTSAANGTIAIGATTVAGTLIYTGSGGTSDRVINLAGTTGGATIQNDGSGALSLTATAMTAGAGTKTLTLQGSNTNTNTISGSIINNSGSNKTKVSKAGTGTWVLSGASSYTDTTTVSAGKLLVNGSLNSGSAATVAVAGTLGGTGTVSGTVTVNGTISAGNSPGTLNTGAETWAGGATNVVEINNATGTAGADPGWDLLNIAGGLNITATSGSKFTIKVVSLTNGNIAGSCANFDNKLSYSWKIAQTTGITGFATNAFIINTNSFVNGGGPAGVFSISQSNTDIYLNFTPVFANPVSVGRAWGTFTRLAVSNLLANTTGNADRLLVSIANVSQTGTPPVIRGSLILLATTNNVTENFQYVVKLTGYDTSLATNIITLSVTNAVGLLKDISSAQNQPSLTFSGVPGYNYIVERSTDLANWIPMDGTSGTTDSRYTVPSNGSAIVWTFTDQNPPTGQAFYRLRQNNSL